MMNISKRNLTYFDRLSKFKKIYIIPRKFYLSESEEFKESYLLHGAFQTSLKLDTWLSEFDKKINKNKRYQ